QESNPAERDPGHVAGLERHERRVGRETARVHRRRLRRARCNRMAAAAGHRNTIRTERRKQDDGNRLHSAREYGWRKTACWGVHGRDPEQPCARALGSRLLLLSLSATGARQSLILS